MKYDFFHKTTAFTHATVCTFSRFGETGFGETGFGKLGFGESGFGESGFGESGLNRRDE